MVDDLLYLASGCSCVSSVREHSLPFAIVAEGECAATRYVEFFTAQSWNPNTRAA